MSIIGETKKMPCRPKSNKAFLIRQRVTALGNSVNTVRNASQRWRDHSKKPLLICPILFHAQNPQFLWAGRTMNPLTRTVVGDNHHAVRP